ncbi:MULTISPECIES: YceI family protein [Reichenbachiella]|uniref:Polyisoprenoid-binding protein YceI n=1 Tax=Reichenbachiella agariperforans TaxID=156994 RepID=A0A1M6L0X3_REIAG|nr:MULTISPECIES: YceI family protein [Reichenbachiella]MBU2913746.1 YceI family protein [Reichenbachiella agariperforans]RJE74321.1 hypothetical protein BGP76_14210 [Reichenbachiella sp. MSK19-1]SHJ64776.1 Polyisoprenoid-binding protein YceI [Reichenbachiella agariperforans]
MKLTTIIFAVIALLAGQTQLKLNKEKSSITIFGTSTVHDWESTVNTFDIRGDKDGNSIKNLKVTMVTKSIKSGKSIMDGKTYDALLEEDHPQITLQADQLTISDGKVTGSGKLALAGQTKTIAISGKVISDNNSQIHIQGANKIDMTQYGIEPPTAMFGSLITGDEVTIKYDIKFQY